jgi:cobalt-zinc-cadmium resistance protein CzcA
MGMLNKIINFSINNKLVIGIFVLALIGYGIFQTTKLPIDAVPDITNNQVQVITIAPSFDALDIERLVTFPIEQVNSNINGMKEIRSFSRFGLSLVTIVFNDDIDIYWARQQVTERLQKIQSQIPQSIGIPELGPVSTGLGEIYQYVVRPKKGYESEYDATALRTIQDWIVRRQLLGVKGVAEVSSMGGKLKQYEIAVDPNKLQAYNLTISDVFTALERNNQNTGGSYIEKGPTALYIRTEGLIGSLKDIGNISIKQLQNGTPLFIRDIATVQIGFANRYGSICYNDKGEVSGAVVMMLKGANSSEVIKNVKERVAQIQKTLPEGVVIEPFLDRTKMVSHAIGTVEKNLIEGALIVIFVLVLFLGNIRAGLIVTSVIPLAMLFAIILMNTFGVSGNLMSLGALDFGLIVDGAVIIVEAVMHQVSRNKLFIGQNKISQPEMDKEVSHSAGRMMNSAVFGQFIILIVYLPIFTLEGIEGKMFKPMAQTVSFALAGAFLLSLTYIPMMSALFLSKKVKLKPTFSDRFMGKLETTYKKRLSQVLSHPKILVSIVIALFTGALFLLSTLGGEFIPALEEGDFAVDIRLLTGSNLNTTIAYTQKASHILLTQFPEVEKVVTKIGSGEVPTDPMPMEAGDIMIILKDKSEWTSAKTFNELSEKMSKALEAVPGMTTGFQYPVQMRFNELMTGARQDVVCKIFGENLDTLALYAKKLAAIIPTIEGAQNLFIEPITGMPQIVISYKRAVMAQFNMNISDINKIVNSAFAGQTTGQVYEEEKRFDLVVRLSKNRRSSLEDVQNLLVPTPAGTQVPLYELAEVSIKNGPNQIQREDAKRRIVVGFNIKGRDVQSIVNELQAKTDKKIKFPTGYYVTYGGAFENLIAAKNRLMVAVPVSLILIFILLYFAFNSMRQGLLIYSAIPLSAIGGILFLALRGMPFSISAGVGFIALFGVSVLNGIVLISEFNRLKKEGMTDLKKIVVEGTSLRLRPVLMTAFVASLGFLPMALSNGAGAEVQRPLATVVIGGLAIATFLTLFVLPVLYILFERNKNQPGAKTLAILLFFLLSGTSFNSNAQTSIDLKTALETATQNSLRLKTERQKADYQQMLIKTAFDLPGTGVLGEYGQINSIYTDNRFGITQSFNFPTVYTRQKNLLTEEWKTALLNTTLKEANLKKAVAEAYYTMIYLSQKEMLLQKSDSLYADFLKKANLRYASGETNILEKSMAVSQQGNARLQLKQVQQERKVVALQFQILLGSDTPLEPQVRPFKINTGIVSDTSLLAQHPFLLILEQQKKESLASTKLERSRLMPSLNLSYYNMTMLGRGNDEVVYSGSKRFQSIQVGLGIPLFYGAQKARIAASQISHSITEKNYILERKLINNEFQTALLKYQNTLETLNYFEQTALLSANEINSAVNKQFSNGEINYLEWVLLTNQALTIKSNYLDAVKAYNESVILLTYLTSKQY